MNLKKVLIILVVVLVVGGVGGYAAYRGYRAARQARLVRQARTFLEKSDYRKAGLALQQALRHNSKDVAAWRLMAQLAETPPRSRLAIEAALSYRSRVVELNPHSNDDRIALAQCAMLSGNYAIATNALEKVDAAGKKTAAYHNLAGAAVLSLQEFAQAEVHFQEAARLDPTNPVPQLNLAVVRLQSTNTQTQAEARASLNRISATYPAVRCQVLRELIMDAVRFRQTNSAVAMAKELVQQTNSTYSDRTLRLSVLQSTRSSELKAALAADQREAGTNLMRIAALGEWQMKNLGPTNALQWLLAQPPVIRTNQPVAVVIDDCLLATRNWKSLQAALDQQDWSDGEFVRHALKARALREQNLVGASKTEWDLAVKVINNDKESLNKLLRLAAEWNWQSEAEELLWAIVNRYPNDKGTFQVLNQVLFQNGHARPLMQLYSQEVKRSPNDPGVKNNLAMTALLLQAQELKPYDLAREAYQMSPTNYSCASTYAFSLYLQGKNAEALQVIQQLKPKELENPTIAGYYGLILKATGNPAKAKVYLDWALKAQSDSLSKTKRRLLLEEEQKLFEKSRAGL